MSIEASNSEKKPLLQQENVVMALMLLGLVVAIIGLWYFGYKDASIFTALLGITGWILRTFISRHFQRIDQNIERNHQILLQATQVGFEFKQLVTKDMYDATKELWKRAVWLAANFKALWPGRDAEIQERQEYLKKLDEFDEYLTNESIILSPNIYSTAKDFVSGITTYQVGRDTREIAGADRELSREGAREMSEGAKAVGNSIQRLFRVFREEFGLDELPGEIVKVPVREQS